jgi:hypothetical protein
VATQSTWVGPGWKDAPDAGEQLTVTGAQLSDAETV